MPTTIWQPSQTCSLWRRPRKAAKNIRRKGRKMSEAARAAPEPALAFWHAVPAPEVIGQLETDLATGLDASEASRRLARFGPNRLPEGQKRGPLVRFLAQFQNVLVYVLLAAGFVKLMLGLWLDSAVILGVVIINALLSFLQEGKAEK